MPRCRPLLPVDRPTSLPRHVVTGIDIDGSQQVSVRDTEVDTADDAICLKTTTPGHPLANVTVSDCRWAEGLRCVAVLCGRETGGKPPSQPAGQSQAARGAACIRVAAACCLLRVHLGAHSSAAYPATLTPGCAPAPPPSSWAAKARQTCATSALRGCP